MATRVPKKDSDFTGYINATTDTLEAATGVPPVTGAARLGLNAAQAAQWSNYRQQWNALYIKYTNKATRTVSVTEDKNNLKKQFTAFAEKPLKQIEISDNITTDDRNTFNLPLPDRTKTNRGKITDTPIGNLKGLGGAILEVRVRKNTDATRSSLHPLADAVEFKYMIADNTATQPTQPTQPPTAKDPNKVPTPSDCPNTVTSRASLWRIDMGSDHAGKRIIGFVRWVNLTNPANNSGWSNLLTTIIS